MASFIKKKEKDRNCLYALGYTPSDKMKFKGTKSNRINCCKEYFSFTGAEILSVQNFEEKIIGISKREPFNFSDADFITE